MATVIPFCWKWVHLCPKRAEICPKWAQKCPKWARYAPSEPDMPQVSQICPKWTSKNYAQSEPEFMPDVSPSPKRAHRNRWFIVLNSMVIFHGKLLVITRGYIVITRGYIIYIYIYYILWYIYIYNIILYIYIYRRFFPSYPLKVKPPMIFQVYHFWGES